MPATTARTLTAAALLATAQGALAAAVEGHSHLASDETRSIPAGPNTQVFRATQSAMIELRRNHVVRRGPDGMFRDVWPVAAIVGSLHGFETAKGIQEMVADAIMDEHPFAAMDRLHDGTLRFTAQDGRVDVVWKYGTNYSSVGALAA